MQEQGGQVTGMEKPSQAMNPGMSGGMSRSLSIAENAMR